VPEVGACTTKPPAERVDIVPVTEAMRHHRCSQYRRLEAAAVLCRLPVVVKANATAADLPVARSVQN
jgi:hypothetical protein